MALLTRYSSLVDNSSSSNIDSISTVRKRASGYSCKNLHAIQRSVKNYSHFESLLQHGRQDILVTE